MEKKKKFKEKLINSTLLGFKEKQERRVREKRIRREGGKKHLKKKRTKKKLL